VPVRRDLGDFQTPPELAAEVLACLEPIGRRWPRVLEPTCGQGHFIAGLLAQEPPPKEIQAIEIQDSHCAAARAASTSNSNSRRTTVRIHQADLFSIDLSNDLSWKTNGPLLVVGNPPWVTSAQLGRLASSFRPPRRRIDGLDGLAALTGASNFDVAEAVWLKLITELADQAPTIALLCKTSVARRILERAHRARLPIETASMRRLDASHWFGAAVDACLFQVRLGAPHRLREVPVYQNLSRRRPESVMSFAGGWLIADREAYAAGALADGKCPLTWRQGVKHDAAAVMELKREAVSGQLSNRTGEILDVEQEFVYPLIKGGDLALARESAPANPERAVLVTQQRIGEDTMPLAELAPRLWSYLQAHSAAFSKRRSSIYRGQPPFAMFGIGPYSFAPYKVAIGALHKEPRFKALGPRAGQPMILDDTCYFLPCSRAPEAAVLTALCNDPITVAFLRSASFKSAKRPVTKALLQRIDFEALLSRSDRPALLARAHEIHNRELGVDSGQAIAEAVAGLERQFSGVTRRPRASESSETAKESLS
jgi:methylase of polypeptide subunit release factors